MLHSWFLRPLTDLNAIKRRLDHVEWFMKNEEATNSMRKCLKGAKLGECVGVRGWQNMIQVSEDLGDSSPSFTNTATAHRR